MALVQLQSLVGSVLNLYTMNHYYVVRIDKVSLFKAGTRTRSMHHSHIDSCKAKIYYQH